MITFLLVLFEIDSQKLSFNLLVHDRIIVSKLQINDRCYAILTWKVPTLFCIKSTGMSHTVKPAQTHQGPCHLRTPGVEPLQL